MVKSRNEEKRQQMLSNINQALKMLQSLSNDSSVEEMEEVVNETVDLLVDSQR